MAGALCHNVLTCVFFLYTVRFSRRQLNIVSGDGIGESLKTCCRVFDSSLALDLHHGPLIYQKSGARVSSSTSGFIEPL